MQQSRIPQLDGLRGIAILSVIAWHYIVTNIGAQTNAINGVATRLLGLSWSGVDLFFVLSGFLIGGILMSMRESSDYFRVFYARRFCRILPLYILILVLFVLVQALTVSVLPPAAFQWLFARDFSLWTYPTFTQNIAMTITGSYRTNWLAATWSLAIEEQFYLLLPLLIRLCPPRRLFAITLACIGFAPVFRVIVWVATGSPAGTFLLLPSRADALMLGVLAAFLVRQPAFLEWFRQRRKPALILTFVLLAGDVLLAQTTRSSRIVISGGYTWIALSYTLILLLAVTTPPRWLREITTHPILIQAGTIAYGLYLFHLPISGLLFGFILHEAPRLANVSEGILLLVSLALSWCAAMLSWRWFERRFIALSHRARYFEPVP